MSRSHGEESVEEKEVRAQKTHGEQEQQKAMQSQAHKSGGKGVGAPKTVEKQSACEHETNRDILSAGTDCDRCSSENRSWATCSKVRRM